MQLVQRMSIGTVERTAILLILAALILMGAFVGYYRWQRGSASGPSLVDTEAARLEEQVRQAPDSLPARISLANLFVQRGQNDAAIAQYEQVLATEETHQGALLGMGIANMQKGNGDGAIEYFNRLAVILDESEYKQLNRQLAMVRYFMGKIHLEKNRLDDAARELEAAMSIDPSNADILQTLGQTKQRLEDHAGAIVVLKQAVTFDPAFTEAYRDLALSYKAEGNGSMAVWAEAMAALFSNDVDGALKKLKATASKVEDADVYWGLGWAYERKGKTDEAVEAYRKALQLNPSHRMAAMRDARLTREERR